MARRQNSSDKKTYSVEESYRGCKITIEDKDVGQELQVDGKSIELYRHSETGAYVSPDAPYKSFGTVEELGRAVVDTRLNEED